MMYLEVMMVLVVSYLMKRLSYKCLELVILKTHFFSFISIFSVYKHYISILKIMRSPITTDIFLILLEPYFFKLI